MDKILKQCMVCNKMFEPCTTCISGIEEDLQWRRVVCCPEHLMFHLPIIRYSRKIIDKDTAKSDLLEAINAYGDIEYNDNVKPLVDEILKETEFEISEDSVLPIRMTKKKTK